LRDVTPSHTSQTYLLTSPLTPGFFVETLQINVLWSIPTLAPFLPPPPLSPSLILLLLLSPLVGAESGPGPSIFSVLFHVLNPAFSATSDVYCFFPFPAPNLFLGPRPLESPRFVESHSPPIFFHFPGLIPFPQSCGSTFPPGSSTTEKPL